MKKILLDAVKQGLIFSLGVYVGGKNIAFSILPFFIYFLINGLFRSLGEL